MAGIYGIELEGGFMLMDEEGEGYALYETLAQAEDEALGYSDYGAMAVELAQ